MSDLTTILASDVINQATKGHQPITDAEIETNCGVCERDVSLASCSIEQAQKTTYNCPTCGNTLLVIDAPGCGRGCRIGDFVLVNEGDLRFRGVFVPKAEK